MMKVTRLCEELCELLHIKPVNSETVQQQGQSEYNAAQLNANKSTLMAQTKALNATNALRSIQKQNDEIVPSSSNKDSDHSRDFLDSIIETDIPEKAPTNKKMTAKKRSTNLEKENCANSNFAFGTPKSNENANKLEEENGKLPANDQPIIKRPRSAEMAKPKNQVTRRRKTGKFMADLLSFIRRDLFTFCSVIMFKSIFLVSGSPSKSSVKASSSENSTTKKKTPPKPKQGIM